MNSGNPPHIAALRQVIQGHLQSFGIRSHIQEALSASEGRKESGPAGRDDILTLLRKKGIIQDFIKSLREQTTVDSLVLSYEALQREQDEQLLLQQQGQARCQAEAQARSCKPSPIRHNSAEAERWFQQRPGFDVESFFSGWNEHDANILGRGSVAAAMPADILSVHIPKSACAGVRNPKLHPSVKLEHQHQHQHQQQQQRGSKGSASHARGAAVAPGLGSDTAGLRPDKSYLFLRLHGGRHFHPAAAGDVFLLSVCFCGQRFISKPVPAAANPAFAETFVLDLSRSSNARAKPEEELLQIPHPVHMVAIRIKPGGERKRLGSASVEWRRVLCCGLESLSVELLMLGAGSSSPATAAVVVGGRVEMDMELRACNGLQPLAPARVASQLEKEQAQRSESIAAFIAVAKVWWREYLQMREAHSTRLVKVLALSEARQARPVCCYLQPVSAGRMLGSPAEAARFVSLLEHEEGERGRPGWESWSNMHTFVARGSGDQEDHAVLLCNLLLGFGLDALVCIGRDSKGGRVWVMTRSGGSGDVIFWESLTGQRYALGVWGEKDARMEVPYTSVSCVFNHQRFYANVQFSDALHECFLDLENEQHWKCLPLDRSAAPLRAPGVAFQVPSLKAFAQEEKLEGFLRMMITQYRQKLRMPSSWSKKLSRLLMPALVAYEQEAIFGGPLKHEEFQQGITRAIPKGHVFKGIPLHFNHLSPRKLMGQLCGDPEFQNLLELRGDMVNFAVRVKITVYPEDVCSCWVMVAVEYPGSSPLL